MELLLAAGRSSTLLAAPQLSLLLFFVGQLLVVSCLLLPDSDVSSPLSIFAVELVELVELVLSLPSAEAGRYPRERYPYPATDGGGQPTRSGLFGMVFVVARRLVVRACVVM